jgi:signal recognition particle subunit SRP54
VTGVILTKMDGDARGGAALSIYGVTHAPIKYVGVGEKLDALEPFHPERLAGRILQQGDILSLVEKAQETVDAKEAEKLARKAVSKKGLDLQDFLAAMRQMQKMGPLKNVLGMLPGMNAMLRPPTSTTSGSSTSSDRLSLTARALGPRHQQVAPAPDRGARCTVQK